MSRSTQVLQMFIGSIASLTVSNADAQSSACRLVHSECKIVYEFFAIERIQEMRDRDTLRSMRPYPRALEINKRSNDRLIKATETGRYNQRISKEISRLAFCGATERVMIADPANQKNKEDYRRNCQ